MPRPSGGMPGWAFRLALTGGVLVIVAPVLHCSFFRAESPLKLGEREVGNVDFIFSVTAASAAAVVQVSARGSPLSKRPLAKRVGMSRYSKPASSAAWTIFRKFSKVGGRSALSVPMWAPSPSMGMNQANFGSGRSALGVSALGVTAWPPWGGARGVSKKSWNICES